MVARVKEWIAQGTEVRIFTTRVTEFRNPDGSGGDILPIVTAIQDWCEKHVGKRLAVANVKDYDMIELWDDRAIGIETNTGEIRTNHETRRNWKNKE